MTTTTGTAIAGPNMPPRPLVTPDESLGASEVWEGLREEDCRVDEEGVSSTVLFSLIRFECHVVQE